MSKKVSKTAATPGTSPFTGALPYALGLAALTLVAFWQVQYNDFLTYDDTLYVTENPWVSAGLSITGIQGAFTQIVASNWQPVTVLSHELDVTLFGLNPRGHHTTNLVLHVLNTLLLFATLTKLTGARGKSAFVAALFAVHPLHVESVAWISSRKDLLSTCFLLLSILAYARYTQSRTRSDYALLCALYALGLMAKSMLMTLPFVLLLLDYWPLRRIDLAQPSWRTTAAALLREKIPLFVLTGLCALIAFYTQHAGHALQGVAVYSLYARINNAIVSYALYALRVFVPYPLAVFYPHPLDALPVWKVAGALLLLLAITLIAVRAARPRPYLLVGWLWYVGMLVPVIGLVQIGGQAMADRYTYVTLIGIFVMLVWEITSRVPDRHMRKLSVAGVFVLVLLTLRTQSYVDKWRDSESLFRETLRVTENNYPAHINLGYALANKGDMAGAAVQFEQAARVVPGSVEGWYNLGSAYYLQNNFARALQAYQQAAEVSPNDFDTRLHLAMTFDALGRKTEALQETQAALQLNPGSMEAQALAKKLQGSNP